ncbi:MAG: hypothetical protein VB835_15240 [Pirellulales bacterium]
MDDQSSGGPSRSTKSRSAKSRQSRQENKSGSPHHGTRSRPWWLGPLAVLVLFLVGLGIWLVPSRTNDVVSVDGRHSWPDEEAPPRRHVIWKKAEAAEPLAAEAGAKESLIRPQLADDGTSLYFTLRSEDGGKDIYRSRLVDGEWQQAAAVAELNTEADDIGPVIQADGEALYLYSNREGGAGGFDLYVSRRTEGGWSDPENLGSNVNSPAHEYDPAIASDGRRLFFASNRSARMHRLIKEGKLKERFNHWKTTLRADLGLNKFDLYAAVRKASGEWKTASPLTTINRKESNEGAPYVAPDNAFIYFVSDRGYRDGEETNFDIFRARIRGGVVADVENLGTGVNTAGNELEPALSPEGFRIYFSRNLEAEETGEQYALFSSISVEIEEQASWDSSNWGAFLSLLSKISWWWVLLCLLIAAMLAAVIWFVRQMSLRRVTVPVFLLAALIMHALLGTGSYFVTFGDGIFEEIREKVKEIVATTIESEDEEPLNKVEQKDYEQMATLESVNRVQPMEVTKQQAETPNVPVPTDSAVPKVVIRISQKSAVDRQQPDSPQPRPQTTNNPQSKRQRPIEAVAQAQIELEQTDSQQQRASETSLPKVDLRVDQQTPSPQIANAAPIRRPIETSIEIAQETIENERTDTTQPLTTGQTPVIDRAVAVLTEPAVVGDVKTLELSAPVLQSTPAAPESVDVDLARQSQAVPRIIPGQIPRSTTPANAEIKLAAAELPIQEIATDDKLESTTNLAEVLANKRETKPAQTESEPVEIAALTAPPISGRPSSLVPRRGLVAVDRQVDNANQASATALRLSPSAAGIGAPTAAGGAQADRVASVQPGSSQRSPVANLTKSSLLVGEAAYQAIATDTVVVADGSGDAGEPTIAGVSVGVDRDDALAVDLNVAGSDQLGGPHRAGNPRLALGELSRQTVDTPLAIQLRGSGKSLRPARAKPVPFFIEDNIGLQASLRLRRIDDSAKKELIRAFGGKPDETLAAIRRGLLWLSTQQHDDGRWRLNEFKMVNGKLPDGQGNIGCDAAATGFALLPFLGDNNTHQAGEYKDHVAKGLKWLTGQQQGSGELTQANAANARMYGHGIATIALCEAYALTHDPALRGPAQRAIDFIVSAQDKGQGGWRYTPGNGSDTSVVGWQVMALKSAQMADLNVPQTTLDGAKKWLNHVAGKGDKLGQFGYTQAGNLKNAMTAEALLCLAYLGSQREDSRMQMGAQHLLKHLPKQGQDSSYYWYYGTQVMYHMQGDYWKQWDNAFSPMLLKTQHKEGHLAGTWDLKDNWERSGGRIFSTSLRVLMLEVYWRHLPLYRVITE